MWWKIVDGVNDMALKTRDFRLTGNNIFAPPMAVEGNIINVAFVFVYKGLPFAVLGDSDMRSEGVEVRARQPSLGGAESGTILTKDAPPTSLFALCSATSAK